MCTQDMASLFCQTLGQLVVTVTITVTITVTVILLKCPKNKRPSGLPLSFHNHLSFGMFFEQFEVERMIYFVQQPHCTISERVTFNTHGKHREHSV